MPAFQPRRTVIEEVCEKGIHFGGLGYKVRDDQLVVVKVKPFWRCFASSIHDLCYRYRVCGDVEVLKVRARSFLLVLQLPYCP